ncbi:MAG: hypothetical protein ACOCTR_01340 [Candidatus Natronoplasma sp.]
MAVAEIISQNFLAIFYTIVVIIILAIIAKVIITREKAKERKELAEMRLKSEKLEMEKKQRHIDKLKEASMVLKDEEKQKVDKIERDKAVLARRSLALMNEMEERMQRLERGSENAKLLRTLQDVKKAERELFGKED